MARDLIRTVVWRRTDGSSLEHCRLWRTDSGSVLDGTVVATLDGEALHCSYEIACPADWRTGSVSIRVVRGEAVHASEVFVDEQAGWWYDGRERPEFRGLVDVDLSITPATNLLPIRRLGLAEGESADVTAVWIRFPDLALEQLPQRYARLGERSYRYESHGGQFTADLEVDELGMVVRYGSLWERVA